VVDLTIENRGDKSFDFGRVSQMLLIDAALEQCGVEHFSDERLPPFCT